MQIKKQIEIRSKMKNMKTRIMMKIILLKKRIIV